MELKNLAATQVYVSEEASPPLHPRQQGNEETARSGERRRRADLVGNSVPGRPIQGKPRIGGVIWLWFAV
ncbi:hypothetical protein ZWY2020_024607 [Hordeum vulgare]|nr:hypothetical protein ZWY2020_024607 [Hordeum vulgare]